MLRFRFNSLGNYDGNNNEVKLFGCLNNSDAIPQYRLINFMHTRRPLRLLRIPPEPNHPSLLIFRAQNVNKFPSEESWKRGCGEKQNSSYCYQLSKSCVCKAVQTYCSESVGIQTDVDDFKFMNSALVYAHTNFLISERMKAAHSLMNTPKTSRETRVDAGIQTISSKKAANHYPTTSAAIGVLPRADDSPMKKFAKFKHEAANSGCHNDHNKSSALSQPVIHVEKSKNVFDDSCMIDFGRAISSTLHGGKIQPSNMADTQLGKLNSTVPSNFDIAEKSFQTTSNKEICSSTGALFEEIRKIDTDVAIVQELSSRLMSVAGSYVNHYSSNTQPESSLTGKRPALNERFQDNFCVNATSHSDGVYLGGNLSDDNSYSRLVSNHVGAFNDISTFNANRRSISSNTSNSLSSSISFQYDNCSNDSHSLTTITFISNELKMNSPCSDSHNMVEEFSNVLGENGTLQFNDNEIDWDRVDELIKDS